MSLENGEIKQITDITRVVVMAGGRGRRLESITQGRIPKDFVPIDENGTIRGVDHTIKTMQSIGLTDIIYSANYYYDMYYEELSKAGVRLHFQEEGDCHGIDLYKIIEKEGADKQYLILTTDILYQPRDIKNLLLNHKPSSITRGVSEHVYREMESYYRTHIDPNSNAIVHVEGSPFQKTATELPTEKVVGSPVLIIDPELYLRLFKIHERYTHKKSNVDLYLDIMWLTTELNRRRVERGRDPILFAQMLDKPHIDYGTPDGLALTRSVYKDYQ